MDLARLERRVEAVGGGDGGRSRENRHPRSRILCRRPVLPDRQDAALYGPAGGAADLRAVRRVRPGAAGAARRDIREIRRGNRPRRRCPTTAPSALRASPARRRTRPMSIRRFRPAGSSRAHPEHRRFRSGRPLAKETQAPYGKAAAYGEQIRAELDREQSGLAGARPHLRDPVRRPDVSRAGMRPRLVQQARTTRLELVLGVQSPYEAAESIAFLLGKARAPFKPARINTQFTYVGGGFGGRDHTPFVLYVALAAMFFPGRPVRLAHDRYQQFQGGIKRHAFKMHSRIGVDRATGKIQAFAADHVLDGGGLANFSPNVATVAATAAIGIYDIPKVDVTTVALHTRGVTAGSMRGYGTLQTMTALEVLIDEAAAALPLNPIEFRRRNALKPNGRTMTGNPYIVSVRTPEILDKLEKHPIWRQRAEEKARLQHSGILVGTGVACVTKDYGTGGGLLRSDGSNSRRTAGSRSIAIMSRWATASAPRWPTAWRSISAASPTKSRWRRSTASMRSGWSPRAIPTRWTRRPRTRGEESALGAGDQFGHQRLDRRPCRHPCGRRGRAGHLPFRPVAGGARALAHPADRSARKGLGQGAAGRTANSLMPGLPPLALPALAAAAHARNFVTGAIAHGFSRWAWSRARFQIGGEQYRAEIDALAVRRGGGKFARTRPRQRPVPADQQQPDRHRLHLDVRHAGPRRDRARHRRAAHRQGLQRVRMRPGAGAGGRARPGAGRLRDGRRLCPAGNAAALRGRPRQRAMESRAISRRARIGPAAARSRDRDAAAADAGRAAEGHGGSRDDPGRAGDPQRHLRRHRPPLPVAAGDRKPCSRERSRDQT